MASCSPPVPRGPGRRSPARLGPPRLRQQATDPVECHRVRRLRQPRDHARRARRRRPQR
ncbi:hypothetical protein SCOCK_60220 [Actinacidiphila cocklensis]|uniref:Uncharacterized protein n=1 Tax=Actinacidiphila cocklensis TaxID=887465 RepID=A0A9W4GVG4_9ACTN|nr:hypothetical protein SCOCK_60220 [Actinacidiphila cocklensis]